MDATKIFRIPLEKEAHDYLLVWSGEPSREFLVRNAYKLLQKIPRGPNTYALQTSYRDFYKQL